VSSKTSKEKGKAPMKMEITVTEALEIINQIRKQPDSLFEMIRADIKESLGQYLTELMDTELTGFLGRDRYQRINGKNNHRNGSYSRRYTLKGIGEVGAWGGLTRSSASLTGCSGSTRRTTRACAS